MNFLNALPKKTMLLVVFLTLIFLFLLYLQFFTATSSKRAQQNQPLPTSILSRNSSPAPQEEPVFKTATTITERPEYTIKFNLLEGLVFPSTIENVAVEREIDESFVSHLKNRLQFQGNPKAIDGALFWQTEDLEKTLLIDPKSGYIQYSNSTNSDISRSETPKLTKKEALAVAEKFINTLNIVNIQPNTETLSLYLQGHGELVQTSDENKAYFYEATYTQGYKGTPIYYHYSTPATISVLVDIFGEVKSLTLFNIKPIKTLTTTLLRLDQMKEKVLRGNYEIVKIDGSEGKIPLAGTLTITTATLAYFDNKQTPLLFPIMLFEGNLQPGNKKISLYVSVLTR